jgi:hypothetical protein
MNLESETALDAPAVEALFDLLREEFNDASASVLALRLSDP